MEKNPNAGASRNRVQRPSAGSILAEFMKGIVHVPVTFVNPSFESGEDEDRWTVILPIEGIYKAVRTQMSGFTPKSELRQVAMAILSNPTAAEPHYCDIPTISDLDAGKVIAMMVPVI